LVAQQYISGANLNKINVIEGNMFDKLPFGFKAHFFSNILHAWSEERMLMLLKNSYDSLLHECFIFFNEL
jgi:hypothetical protein